MCPRLSEKVASTVSLAEITMYDGQILSLEEANRIFQSKAEIDRKFNVFFADSISRLLEGTYQGNSFLTRGNCQKIVDSPNLEIVFRSLAKDDFSDQGKLDKIFLLAQQPVTSDSKPTFYSVIRRKGPSANKKVTSSPMVESRDTALKEGLVSIPLVVRGPGIK